MVRTTALRSLGLLLAVSFFTGPSIATELVLVVSPVDRSAESEGVFSACTSGSRIILLDADGGERTLTPDFDGACDPSVSFDGTEILFSGRKDPGDSWQIWRMATGGGDSVSVTAHEGGAWAPVWVGSIFHLNDEAPSPRIAYLAAVPGLWEARALHSASHEGDHPLRISYSPTSDLAADVLPNGRLVYPSWNPSNPAGSNGLSIMGLGIDGTDLAAFADPHGSATYSHAVGVGGRHLYFIESESPRLDGGKLAAVTLRRPLRSRAVIATTDNGVFLDPTPLADGTLLASYRRIGSDGFEIVRVDPDTGLVGPTVYRKAGHHCLDAQELRTRPHVSGRSTVVDLEKTTGVFFCISTHITDRPSLRDLGAGRSRTLRVIQAIPYDGDDPPGISERVLGEAPIEADGSFHIEVPARTPLRFQLINDEGGVSADQQSWTWVMPREWRGCVGCHENREMVAPNVLADAVIKPAVPVGLPRKPHPGGD